MMPDDILDVLETALTESLKIESEDHNWGGDPPAILSTKEVLELITEIRKGRKLYAAAKDRMSVYRHEGLNPNDKSQALIDAIAEYEL